MRIARPVLLTASALSLTACAIITDGVRRESGEIFELRPGQYRVRPELVALEAPGAPDRAVPQMTEVFAEGLEGGHIYCATPEDISDRTGGPIFGGLTEGDCDIDMLDVSGEDVRADMQCRYKPDIVGRVGLTGWIAAESAGLVMTMDQDFEGVGSVRTVVRIDAERVGDCSD